MRAVTHAVQRLNHVLPQEQAGRPRGTALGLQDLPQPSLGGVLGHDAAECHVLHHSESLRRAQRRILPVPRHAHVERRQRGDAVDISRPGPVPVP
uniref:Uncharacterized protein n=1 Tax=Tetraselmis sp. GSL018 TaxID=582737 RepID=A0A061QJK5_9CHLO